MPENFENSPVIHPTTLDTVLQISGPNFLMLQNFDQTPLPVSIDGIIIAKNTD